MAYVELTKANFEEVITSNDTVVVDYWAEWCGPCKMMSPHIESLRSKYGPNLSIVKVDTDKSIEVSQYFIITMHIYLFN